MYLNVDPSHDIFGFKCPSRLVQSIYHKTLQIGVSPKKAGPGTSRELSLHLKNFHQSQSMSDNFRVFSLHVFRRRDGVEITAPWYEGLRELC